MDGELHVTLTGWDRHRPSTPAFCAGPAVVVLQMANPDVTDDTLDYLSGMAQLRELDLNDTAVTDAGLAKLARLGTLQSLRLKDTAITDAGFRDTVLPA